MSDIGPRFYSMTKKGNYSLPELMQWEKICKTGWASNRQRRIAFKRSYQLPVWLFDQPQLWTHPLQTGYIEKAVELANNYSDGPWYHRKRRYLGRSSGEGWRGGRGW